MSSKLLRVSPYDAQNQFELSLAEAYNLLEPLLRPLISFPLLSPSQYAQLNHAILYGVLSEPHFAKVHIKHLHAIVTDGYTLFVTLLTKIVIELYPKLVDSAKIQLIHIASEMIHVLAIGMDGLLASLLRRINGADFGDENSWLRLNLVSLFMENWDLLLEEVPSILATALYAFLRVVSDHRRFLVNNWKFEMLKQLEIGFCVRLLTEQFQLCLTTGRDLIRLLHDLIHIPQFHAIWRKLILNPSDFNVPGFSDISQIYKATTPHRFFLLPITPEMETDLHFMLTRVKLGCQKRHQTWFANKFLHRETLICDIVRFICCCHHPPNDIIQSDVIQRWAVVGWLLKCCRKCHVEANVKLALFYDWIFFDEKVDNIMNIEPAILLMVNSVPHYIEITHNILEFLLLLVENYDVERLGMIRGCVSSAFDLVVRKRVIPSLDALTSCQELSPVLRGKLADLQFGTR